MLHERVIAGNHRQIWELSKFPVETLAGFKVEVCKESQEWSLM
jgi:hypothetical protein